MGKKVRNSADMLPKPLKPAKPVMPVSVIAIIRKGRKVKLLLQISGDS